MRSKTKSTVRNLSLPNKSLFNKETKIGFNIQLVVRIMISS